MADSAAVEAKDELVEVGLQVLAPEAVVNAEGPAPEVFDHAVGLRQDEVGGHAQLGQ